ncbi:tetratricopeptide repeat protein SKI3 isoform X2 [Momordica charantia]|uniref:Tetratricopeptide repeat protein SKI3 isoform X2 n=1 Tax=Momordica charantia TaxID=3673 RepID=A0A6J1DW27_MOMCH|nr:tetratricopeptide repeat protein SKI3 isoform X2 [Momordica charantia]
MEEIAVEKEHVGEPGTPYITTIQLQEAVDAHPDDPSSHLKLGIFLWDNGRSHDKAAAADHFLKSAKLDNRNGAAFKYLGHYYATFSVDIERALKCYQRAVSLDAEDFQSGEALCNLLHHEGKESLEVAICKEASAKSPRAFWAFRRLGYLQVYEKKWAEAVLSLQHAIRGYPSCADLWEALGLAYQRLGRFTAAIKSYARAIEIEEDRVLAWVESGNIFLTLGSFKKQALEISPKSITAQFGLSSGLLGLAKECINKGAFKWASFLSEEASKVARGSTHLAGNLSCIWKLLGDIQLTYAKCYPWMGDDCGVGMSSESFRSSVLSWKQTCSLALFSARCSYQQALHLAPWEANIYTDIAITLDLISSSSNDSGSGFNSWQISEKMTLGALMLEGDNHEFWVAMGCLSNQDALKQHAYIRALQLDGSLAVAWAYLGKLYRNRGEKQLAKEAFDYARSIDPSLAIPWAGMSADLNIRESTSDEAFESCLRAAQILPVAEFQIGLARLSLQAGHLSSPQVFGAIRQAVQLAPCYPESHNLNGLAFEAHLDYQSAVAAYRLARLSISYFSNRVPRSHVRDISINLARSLCMVGNFFEASQECENLTKEGMLDVQGLQVYAFSLWQFGKNEQALTAVRTLAAGISTMERTCVAASVSFICRLLYTISGLDPAISSIMKMPKDFFQSSKMSFVVFAIHAIDWSDRLEPIVLSSRSCLRSHEEITKMHFLIALSKLIKHRSDNCLGFRSGVMHLRKALHAYPNSSLIRNLLGYLLLSNEERDDSHSATRCCNMLYGFDKQNGGLKSAYEIHGAGAVACYTIGTSHPRFSFPTCSYQCQNGIGIIRELQKCLHQEPWNYDARYLLILNFLQKAREERFPYHLRVTIERLISVAFSNELYLKKDTSYQYKKFQLLLCASEISFQGGSQIKCINYAEAASSISLPDNYLFCAHLLLCRAYAAENDSNNLRREFIKCLDLQTDNYLGWVCLKFIASRYELHAESNILERSFKECLKERENLQHMSMPMFSMVDGLTSFWSQDFMVAEKFFAQACSLGCDDVCHLLCHGVTCMELARQLCSSHFLMLAVNSLLKAQVISVVPVPIVSIMLAQAEGSLGLKEKWESNLRFEWFSWPPDMRSAELLFQMHLFAKQSKVGSDQLGVESRQPPLRWVLRAIHVNPSCMRYWKVLQSLWKEI